MGERSAFRFIPGPLTAATALVYLFLYLPIAVLVALSFNSSRFSTVWQGFTWDWYVIAWRDDALVAALRTSLLVAALTALGSVAIGTAAAVALVKSRPVLRRAAEGLVFLPIIVPEIVIGFATAGLFGFAGLAFGLTTIIAAHIAFSISYVVFVVRARLVGLDPSLEEAAMDLGATRWESFLKVTFPQLLPGIFSAALLVFTISLDDYVITSFVAGPGSATLPLKIYSMVKTGVTPEINAISSVLLVATLVILLASERIASGGLSKRVAAAGFGGFVLISAFAVGGAGPGPGGGELNLSIWSNYIPQTVIEEFERTHSARVNVELYDSNEALLAKLQSDSSRYDVVVPSDYMVGVLNAHGLIQPLDRELLTNFSNLDPRFTGLPYDSENSYSVPYMWGTTGIAYRRDKVTDPIDSWATMWNPRYRDRLAMLDDVREVFGAALKLMGRSVNSTDLSEIEAAARLLIDQKPLVKAYDSGGFDQLLLSGDAWVVQAYSGQIARLMLSNSDIGYVIPREGSTVFVDNLCVPARSGNPRLAHEFINFVLDSRIAADIANGTGYSTANLAARRLVRPELLTNAAAYPDPEHLDRCETVKDLGATITFYDRLWTEIKSK